MTGRQFLAIVEIQTKIISLSTFLMGTLYAVISHGTFSWAVFAVTAGAVLCVDMGTTGFNTYFDHKIGTDKADYTVEKVKVLVHEDVDPKSALFVSLILFAIASVLGLILAALTSWYLIIVGGASFAAGYLYTGGPFPISRTPLGELFAGGFLGTVLFMISYFVQEDAVSWNAFFASLPVSLFIASILTVNNTCDIKGDRLVGRKTLSILLGERLSRILIFCELTAAYAAALLLAGIGIFPEAVIPFLGAAFLFSIPELLRMHKRGYSLETKEASMGSIAKLFLLFTGAILLGELIQLIYFSL
ncbi:MAG: UbiA family prenyltransferase [Spirochaetales bacterium]|nr:UbiA family prenyltransferase [Spirochaetales bacterium]